MSEIVKVGRLEDLPEAKAVRVERADGAVCVVRIGAEVYAIDDLCSHEDYSLAEGEVDVEECAIECWKHGSLFSLSSGEPLTFPATRPVATYVVEVHDGEVSVVIPGGEAQR